MTTLTEGRTNSRADRRLTSKERQAKALELRTGGASYDQIAQVLGLSSKQSAHALVKRAIDAIPHEAVAELRAVELARLDEIEMRLRQRLRSGDASVAGTLLRLADQRAKLTGIYQAPEGMGDLSTVREVFGGFMAAAQAFAQAPVQGELEELVVVEESP